MINNSDHKIGHKGDYQVHTERIMVNNSDHRTGHKGDYIQKEYNNNVHLEGIMII